MGFFTEINLIKELLKKSILNCVPGVYLLYEVNHTYDNISNEEFPCRQVPLDRGQLDRKKSHWVMIWNWETEQKFTGISCCTVCKATLCNCPWELLVIFFHLFCWAYILLESLCDIIISVVFPSLFVNLSPFVKLSLSLLLKLDWMAQSKLCKTGFPGEKLLRDSQMSCFVNIQMSNSNV